MTINNSNQPSPINHPPLAHDAQGCKVAVPTGTTHWRIQRFTGGRPKLMPGRFDLDLTAEQLVEMCGPGQYRIEALDEYGRPLGEIAKLVAGVSPETATADTAANQNVRPVPSSDTRFMLETIAQMSRAHSESLQSLASSQADWIKMLANAKQIPRNAAPVAQQIVLEQPDVQPSAKDPWWIEALKPSLPLFAAGLARNVSSWIFGVKPDEQAPPKRRNAMPHLGTIAAKQKQVPFDERKAEVLAMLEPDEREPASKVLEDIIRPFFAEVFIQCTAAQSVEFLRAIVREATKQMTEQAS